MLKKACPASAFTLLEMSVVVTIIALVTGMALTGGIAVLNNASWASTQQKMAAIDQALMAYRAANDRLPCPGDLTLTSSSSNYGYEAGFASGGTGTGECKTGMTPAANNETTGVTNLISSAAEGSVPTSTLGIPNDFMYDGWGHRFRYVVDIGMTGKGAFTASGVGCLSGAITVYDATGSQTRTSAAIYALVSHGMNGHGGYTKNGVVTNASSTNANEQTNCHCNSSAATTTYAATYVQADYTPSTNTPNSFDDIVSYKERWQMQVSWDTANAMCGIGNMFISDFGNNRIRKVIPGTGIINSVAGNGTAGYSGDNGAGTSAKINQSYGVGTDIYGNLYIADYTNYRIRKVSITTGVITTYAGTGTLGYSGDGSAATSAQINTPRGIVSDSSGNIYFGDPVNNRVRKITAATGIITTYAGNGSSGSTGDSGLATSATLNFPNSLAMDSSNNLYIATTGDYRVRKVTASTGIITTYAGNGSSGATGDGSAATSATFNYPAGVAVDGYGNLYIADFNNCRIRKVTASTGIISTVAGTGTCNYSGDGGAAISAQINTAWQVATDSANNFYISDTNNCRIRKVTPAGTISTYAGSASCGFSGDAGPATSATTQGLWGVAITR